MKIYLAVSGSYSDFSVHHAFTTAELAQAYADQFYEGDVTELELRDQPVERRAWYTLSWWPHLGDRKADTVANANPTVWDNVMDYDPSRKLHHEWQDAYRHATNKQRVLRVEGWDRKAVMKVYSEQRARYLAEQEGIS